MTGDRTYKRLAGALAAGVIGGALMLTGCSGDDDAASSTTGMHDHGINRPSIIRGRVTRPTAVRRP